MPLVSANQLGPQRIENSERLYAVITILVIFISHVNAFYAFGATFWIDSLGYMALGDALFDPAKLKSFYDGLGFWSYSHYGAGLPSLWCVMKFFPVAWQWPFLAVFQHLVAAASCWLAFAWSIRPSALSLCGVSLLSLLPFYESGHQMLMTESLSASLLLIALALTIRLITTQWSDLVFWLLLAAMFVVTQMRSYFGLMVAALALVVLVSTRKWRSVRAIALLIVLGVSILAFPTYRFILTERFFLPSWGVNALYFALRANPKPSSRLVPIFEQSDFPPKYPAGDVLKNGLQLVDLNRITEYWRLKGLTDAQIKARVDQDVQALFHDGLRPTINRILYGLNSSGFLFPYKSGPAAYEVTRGKNMDEEWTFQLAYYRWFSWIDSGDYQNSFNYFFRSPQLFVPLAVEPQKNMIAALEPYLKPKTTYLRDPLFLGAILIDVWCLLGVVAIVLLCLRRNLRLTAVFIIPVAINFAATAAAAVPNVRYAYALVPIYFFASVVGLQTLLSKPARKPRLLVLEKPRSHD